MPSDTADLVDGFGPFRKVDTRLPGEGYQTPMAQGRSTKIRRPGGRFWPVALSVEIPLCPYGMVYSRVLWTSLCGGQLPNPPPYTLDFGGRVKDVGFRGRARISGALADVNHLHELKLRPNTT